MSSIVKTTNLDYSFNAGEKILDNINLDIPDGSIYGFLGPNGAGKTTTLRLLLGLLQIKTPGIRILGRDFKSNRISILRSIGSLIEQPSLYLHLTGNENLEIFRLSYDLPKSRIAEVLTIVGLRDAANKKTKAYSLGMKQRLAIAIALLHDPELLILDEPTNGLDPNGIVEIRDLISKLNQQHGKTIIISSHLLSEVEKIVTHVGIIHHGKLLFQGTFPELQKLQSNHSFIEINTSDNIKAMDILGGAISKSNMLRVHYKNDKQLAEINRTLVLKDFEVYHLARVKNDLEEIFMELIAE
ncbi:ABC transporter ATP-binding protein [Daejeonella sp.]|uniref:ABC transporter ATP-binding protein n=1 Tax=Daejeonella sp. TaxID=2805397 RepID=UPI00272EE992|nr:ABC transporter ATP-binding protein [Daejeonella sp.]MDP2413032.1 ABC transporter ATP-binding protein [Daejeonella sp.]